MNNDINRRKFLWLSLGGLGTLLAALIGIPIVGLVISPLFKKKESKWIPVAWLEDLKSTGPQEVKYSYFKEDAWLHVNVKKSVYIIRDGDQQFTVFSSECTHLGCPVHWNATNNKFLCPCHGGKYDMTGKVVGGPPPRPMMKFETKIENSRLFIKSA